METGQGGSGQPAALASTNNCRNDKYRY